MSDQIDVIPEPTVIAVGGEQLAIGPLKVRQIPAFTRAVRPFMGEMGKDQIDWVGLIADHGEGVIVAMSIATGKDTEWIGDLDGGELLRLVQKVVEVNVDFFVQALMPVMRGMVVQMMAKMVETLGRTSSSASSAEATAAMTS